MKYLKSYKVFEATHEELQEQLSEEIQWIKDSLLELVDTGCNIAVSPFEIKSIGRPGLRIGIVSPTDRLIPISVGEHLLTIDSYLREKGFVGYRPYDYDNPYSPSRHQVKVNAMLKDVKNMFENELSQFVKMLDRFDTNAPFDSISVSYYKPEPEINESKIVRDAEVKLDVKDILLELELSEIKYSIEDFKYYKDKINPYNCILVKLKAKRHSQSSNMYEGKLFNLEEIEDVVLRLEEYLKQTNYSIDVAIPNTMLTDLETQHYPLQTFMNDFRDEEFSELNLYIWRGFNLTW